MVLQETKLVKLGRKEQIDLWGRSNWCFIHKKASNTAGGILIAWCSDVMSVVDSRVDRFSISVKFKNVADSFIWSFSGVYGPQLAIDKVLLW